jgi:phosphohistidine swiveling domain-containing protein
MPLIKTFSEISKNDIIIAGGKGASLGEMTQAGFPVPKGFIVLSSSFESFLKEANLNIKIDSVLNLIDYQKTRTIENASKKIRYLILNAKMSKELKDEIQKFFEQLSVEYVAVRSSATAEDSENATWAGQLDSYLNITGEDLIEKVKRCWASLFTPRAIFYRFEKKLQKQKISVAVVIQEMIESEKSGIAFSVHPITQDKNRIIIEAGFGLGEAIVSGLITPDVYVASKKNKIIDINIYEQARMLSRKDGGGSDWSDLGVKGSEQVLNEKEILKLADIVKKIEKYYKKPQDIEWAYFKGNFFITQSRSITTLNPTEKQQSNKSNDYTLHFSGTGFNILLLDMIFNNNNTYGAVDYVVIYENGINRAYLSTQGIKESYVLSTLLLNDIFFRDLFIKSKKLCKELKNYKSVKLNSKNIHSEWKKIKLFNDKFCKLYRFYEQFFQQALESRILDFISEKKLNKILSENSLDSISDNDLKKYIRRLISMGEMKLLIHKNSEKFSLENSIEKYIAKMSKLPLELVGAMRKNEIDDAINGKITVSADELKKRLQGCVFVKEKGRWNLYTENKFIFWKNKIQKDFHNNKITGQIAFRGIAKGKVVVHLSWTGVTKIRKGAIFVTGMINPQMITSIKKASAIVTDEGGITCHAAIISRELKKPCIVGTKNATQILKTGDLVEVDANNGVVRIIKS